MTPPPPADELRRATVRLKPGAFALVLGLIGGVGLFLATNWLVLKGGPPDEYGDPIVGPNLSLLNQYLVGYEVSFLGSLIGFLWLFSLGAVAGYLIGTIYNRLVARERARP